MMNCSSSDKTLRQKTVIGVSSDDIGFFCYYYITFLLITVINICGNILVIFSSIRRRSLRTPENYFIISLATSDLIHGIFYTVYNISHMELPAILTAFNNWGVCMLLLLSITGMEMVSSYSMTAITATRYIAIIHPLSFPNKVTPRNCGVCVCLTWLMSLILVLSVYARPKADCYTGVCRYELFLGIGHITVFTTFTFLIPFSVMLSMYIRIISIARKQVLQINNIQQVSDGRPSQRRLTIRQELHLARTIGVLFGCFAAAYIPFIIFTFITTLSRHTNINRYIRGTVRILLHANSAVNVFIYAGRMSEFRQAFKADIRLVCCYCRDSAIFSKCKTVLFPQNRQPSLQSIVGQQVQMA